jgi:hypothetical protein
VSNIQNCFVSDASGQKLVYFYFEEGWERIAPSDRYYFLCRSQLR